jgi:MFS family permease
MAAALLGWRTWHDVVAAGMVAFIVGSSSLTPITRRIASLRARRGLSIGLANLAGNAGSSIGAPLAGYLMDLLHR